MALPPNYQSPPFNPNGMTPAPPMGADTNPRYPFGKPGVSGGGAGPIYQGGGQPKPAPAPGMPPADAGVPLGGIRKNWQPNNPEWVAQMEKMYPGMVQKLQGQMTEMANRDYFQARPQGSNRADVWGILQQAPWMQNADRAPGGPIEPPVPSPGAPALSGALGARTGTGMPGAGAPLPGGMVGPNGEVFNFPGGVNPGPIGPMYGGGGVMGDKSVGPFGVPNPRPSPDMFPGGGSPFPPGPSGGGQGPMYPGGGAPKPLGTQAPWTASGRTTSQGAVPARGGAKRVMHGKRDRMRRQEARRGPMATTGPGLQAPPAGPAPGGPVPDRFRRFEGREMGPRSY